VLGVGMPIGALTCGFRAIPGPWVCTFACQVPLAALSRCVYLAAPVACTASCTNWAIPSVLGRRGGTALGALMTRAWRRRSLPWTPRRPPAGTGLVSREGSDGQRMGRGTRAERAAPTPRLASTLRGGTTHTLRVQAALAGRPSKEARHGTLLSPATLVAVVRGDIHSSRLRPGRPSASPRTSGASGVDRGRVDDDSACHRVAPGHRAE